VRPTHEAFCAEFQRLIREILASSEIDFAQIDPRTKSVESFVDKIRRKNDKYDNPIADITDLAGLRIIAYFAEDVMKIGALIEQHFAVDWEHSKRQSGTSEPDRFGYRSDHYVVRFSKTRLRLPENQRFRKLAAEIQVRTVMQHAWAAVDHRLRYKSRNASELPVEVRRRLYRLSALLEVADDQFAAVKRAAEEVEAAYVQDVGRGELSAELDAFSVEAYVEHSSLLDTWASRALTAGFAPATRDEPLDPAELAARLKATGAKTLQDMQHFFSSAEDWGPSFLEEFCRLSKTNGFAPRAVPADILIFLTLSESPDEEAVRATSYKEAIQDALIELRRHRHSTP
jgi:putative GTP pyrophosphokinase